MKSSKTRYLLVKKSSFSTSGALLDARESAMSLLGAGIWPLFENTRCRKMVTKGQQVLIYLGGEGKGNQCVIASAVIDSVVPWSEHIHKKVYPLILDGTPSIVMNLSSICLFDSPIGVKPLVPQLSFVPKTNYKKWGAALVGGVLALSDNDFSLLSGNTFGAG